MQTFVPRDAFSLMIQRELCHPKCARKVSGLSRNGPQVPRRWERATRKFVVELVDWGQITTVKRLPTWGFWSAGLLLSKGKRSKRRLNQRAKVERTLLISFSGASARSAPAKHHWKGKLVTHQVEEMWLWYHRTNVFRPYRLLGRGRSV